MHLKGPAGEGAAGGRGSQTGSASTGHAGIPCSPCLGNVLLILQVTCRSFATTKLHYVRSHITNVSIG